MHHRTVLQQRGKYIIFALKKCPRHNVPQQHVNKQIVIDAPSFLPYLVCGVQNASSRSDVARFPHAHTSD